MEKPILFNGEMVRAILDGRKTQTRRLIRPQPEGQMCYVAAGTHYGKWHHMSEDCARAWDVDLSRISKGKDRYWKAPYNADDLLYVRETWNYGYIGFDPNEFSHVELFMKGINHFCYRADYDGPTYGWGWKPSIHMPKAAARIWLKVKRVRVERLKDITEDDAVAEGCLAQSIFPTARDYFAGLWNTTHGVVGKGVPENWALNPWVWVIDFERLEGKQ